MPKLLLTIDSPESDLRLTAGRVRASRAVVEPAACALGDMALLCGASGAPREGYFASAVVAALVADRHDPDVFELDLESLRYFRRIVATDELEGVVGGAGTAPLQPLDDAQFDAVLQAAASGFAEDAQAALLPEENPPGDLAREVLAAYGNICAFTGAPLFETSPMSAETLIVAIMPVASGGARSPGNYIAAVPEAQAAFSAGHLTLGPTTGFIAALEGIDPELLEHLNPTGRLRAPSSTRHRPDAVALEYHRSHIFGRP